MKQENVPLKENYKQVCIWDSTIVGKEIEEFTAFMLEELNTRVQYLEEIKTNPDLNKDNEIINGTGGRNDLLFAIHNDDISKFAINRIPYNIRWIEDVYLNGGAYLYPKRIADYKSW